MLFIFILQPSVPHALHVYLYFRSVTGGGRADKAVCPGGGGPIETQPSVPHALQQVHPGLPPPFWPPVSRV